VYTYEYNVIHGLHGRTMCASPSTNRAQTVSSALRHISALPLASQVRLQPASTTTTILPITVVATEFEEHATIALSKIISG
jgi:hypothetical protein